MVKATTEAPWVTNSLFIADQHQRYEKVNKIDILYIRAEGGWVDVVTEAKTYNLSTNLGTIKPQLDPAYFVRVSRKHIVNIHRIEAVQGGVLTVAGHPIMIGRQFRATLLEQLPFLRTKYTKYTVSVESDHADHIDEAETQNFHA